jgi:diadenosine tetraphosphate (Ap4A) HIT family hydrolase
MIMRDIESADGKKSKSSCIGCDLQSGKLKRIGELIAETKNFTLDQDFETPIPGFLIISSKKHIKGIEDLSSQERIEFIEFLSAARKALTDILGVKYVYIIQKEDTIISRSHFHVWLFPRYEWMDQFGGKIESVTKIIEYARNNMKDKKHIDNVIKSAYKIKKYIER